MMPSSLPPPETTTNETFNGNPHEAFLAGAMMQEWSMRGSRRVNGSVALLIRINFQREFPFVAKRSPKIH